MTFNDTSRAWNGVGHQVTTHAWLHNVFVSLRFSAPHMYRTWIHTIKDMLHQFYLCWYFTQSSFLCCPRTLVCKLRTERWTNAAWPLCFPTQHWPGQRSQCQWWNPRRSTQWFKAVIWPDHVFSSFATTTITHLLGINMYQRSHSFILCKSYSSSGSGATLFWFAAQVWHHVPK